MDLAGHRRSLGVDFAQRLGAGGRAAYEDAFGGGLGSAVLAVEDLDEAVFVAVDVEHFGDVRRVDGRHHPRAEHDEVGPQHLRASRGDVLDLHDRPAGAVELHLGRRTAQELDAGKSCRREPVLVTHSGGPHLQIADGDLHRREELLEADGVFEGDHAAQA